MARRIILKQSTSSGSLPDGFLELSFDGSNFSQKIGATLSNVSSGGGGGGVDITDARNNVLVPDFSLNVTTTGSHNVALGYHALNDNTTGNHNIAQGYRALFANTTGSYNVALGRDSLYTNTTGNNNVALGRNALRYNTTGGLNVGIGYNVQTGGFTASVILGAAAAATGNNQFVVGSCNQNAGTVTTESCSSTSTWTVRINGLERKILLA